MNISFDFENETKRRGKVLIDGMHFANFYTLNPKDILVAWIKEKTGKKEDLIVFNRDAWALRIKFPIAPGYFDNLEQMEKWIYETQKKNPIE